MKITIPESDMLFGEFNEEDLFHIETSNIYKDIGSNIKTVDFILKQKNNIILLEAKKSCPNASNKDESHNKQTKFEEYYSSITDKFIESLQIFLASILNKLPDNSDVGTAIKKIDDMKDIQIQFILVIKNAHDIAWLAGPLAELNNRLLQYRKIWKIKIKVLNEELAKEMGLICNYK